MLRRVDIHDAILEKAHKDARFREQLLADPRGTIEAFTKKKLPAGLTVHVMEDKPNEFHLVLPPRHVPKVTVLDPDLDRFLSTTSNTGCDATDRCECC